MTVEDSLVPSRSDSQLSLSSQVSLQTLVCVPVPCRPGWKIPFAVGKFLCVGTMLFPYSSRAREVRSIFGAHAVPASSVCQFETRLSRVWVFVSVSETTFVGRLTRQYCSVPACDGRLTTQWQSSSSSFGTKLALWTRFQPSVVLRNAMTLAFRILEEW